MVSEQTIASLAKSFRDSEGKPLSTDIFQGGNISVNAFSGGYGSIVEVDLSIKDHSLNLVSVTEGVPGYSLNEIRIDVPQEVGSHIFSLGTIIQNEQMEDGNEGVSSKFNLMVSVGGEIKNLSFDFGVSPMKGKNKNLSEINLTLSPALNIFFQKRNGQSLIIPTSTVAQFPLDKGKILSIDLGGIIMPGTFYPFVNARISIPDSK